MDILKAGDRTSDPTETWMTSGKTAPHDEFILLPLAIAAIIFSWSSTKFAVTWTTYLSFNKQQAHTFSNANWTWLLSLFLGFMLCIRGLGFNAVSQGGIFGM
jgi:hypothetical protein